MIGTASHFSRALIIAYRSLYSMKKMKQKR